MANMADSIRQAKMMTGSTGAGAGKAVSDEDVDRLRKMMAERNMANTESQNATTDMDAEKAGMIKKLMRLMRQETGNTGKMKESGRGMSNMDRSRLENMMGKRKGMMGGGPVKKYKGGGCVMPGRGKSRAMNK